MTGPWISFWRNHNWYRSLAVYPGERLKKQEQAETTMKLIQINQMLGTELMENLVRSVSLITTQAHCLKRTHLKQQHLPCCQCFFVCLFLMNTPHTFKDVN